MNLEELRKIREKAEKDIELRQKKTRIKVVVGMGTSGIAAGARDTLKTFVEEISNRNLLDVVVTQTGEEGAGFPGAHDRSPRRRQTCDCIRQRR